MSRKTDSLNKLFTGVKALRPDPDGFDYTKALDALKNANLGILEALEKEADVYFTLEICQSWLRFFRIHGPLVQATAKRHIIKAKELETNEQKDVDSKSSE